ncbi:MAG: phage integrase N-terminal SAM-like domain-containing protein, partial [Desulfobacterales bacterium]|nr:phage integrase N-terminal SAM-like domain-containing protein [Desulfobacterales bacterium]
MTEFRTKMIRTMELKNLSHQTQKSDLAAVTGIARFYNQSPDKMTKEQIEVCISKSYNFDIIIVIQISSILSPIICVIWCQNM